MSHIKSQGTLIRKKSFQSLRQLIKRKIKDSYHVLVYLENLFGLGDGKVCDSKKLFSFLKNSKQDQQGTPPLKDGDKIITDTAGKANTTINKFHSVFTPMSPLSLTRLSQMKVQDSVDSGLMDPPTIPSEYLTITPVLSDTDISLNGILKLLTNLKPGKAAGPDKLRPLLLKELRSEIAPIIKVNFQKTLETGQTPAEWCRANVTPIFKKEDKSLGVNYRPISLTCILCIPLSTPLLLIL